MGARSRLVRGSVFKTDGGSRSGGLGEFDSRALSLQLEPWERVTDRVASMVAVDGLDLAAPVDVNRYNAVVDEPYRVPTFDRESTLGIVLGNTKAMWPCFVEAMKNDTALFASENPLDDYVMGIVREAVAHVPFETEVRFSHEPPPRRVAMQRLAEIASLAWLSPAHLSIHPTYGPWFALRALVVVDLDGPPTIEPPAPCAYCESGCKPTLAWALGSDDPNDWIAVRDACPMGAKYRYNEPQLRYHYEKDRNKLRRFLMTGRWTTGEPPR